MVYAGRTHLIVDFAGRESLRIAGVAQPGIVSPSGSGSTATTCSSPSTGTCSPSTAFGRCCRTEARRTLSTSGQLDRYRFDGGHQGNDVHGHVERLGDEAVARAGSSL